ncbi:hypothetical protein BDW42DRAFT_177693 [Aspergillus taichungensis]|uniref:Secreted peptide n=1 Tax=Aspergillus taichungensis TaxID=482145 RepID=A0A2J5HIQ3_9EURO|nr:hypothetical protein BDW42DRAFT_177693 [Aspergillus taichungensis]
MIPCVFALVLLVFTVLCSLAEDYRPFFVFSIFFFRCSLFIICVLSECLYQTTDESYVWNECVKGRLLR